MKYHLTPKSANAKTGPIPVSTSSADTCPPSCPFHAAGCYASAGGPLALHWRKVTEGERGMGFDDFCSAIANLPEGQLWRHNQAGDLPGVGEAIDRDALGQLIESNRGRRGFTYSHKYTLPGNLETIADANARGFVVNLSANSPAHADTLAGQGSPVTTVLPADVNGAVTPTLRTPRGLRVVVCPATYRDGVSCATCRLCAAGDRKVIVGFPAHGGGARKVTAAVAASQAANAS